MTVYLYSYMLELNELLNDRTIWRARDLTRKATINSNDGASTGFPELDNALPNRGWPEGALIEILSDKHGIGELRLLAPSLSHIEQTKALWTVWINPPYLPYAPALESIGLDVERTLLVHPRNHKEALWAIEESLSSGGCGALLVWLHEQRIDEKQLRRIQWRSKQAQVRSFLFRPITAQNKASPAVMRLKLDSAQDSADHSLNLSILKRPGGWRVDGITLNLGSDPAKSTFEQLTRKLTTWRQSMQQEG